MIDIKKVLVGLGALAKDNIPAILEGVSIGSSIGSTVGACIAQNKVDAVIADMSDEEKADKKNVIKQTWFYYIVPAGLEGLSIYTGIKSHSVEIAKFQQALLAASAVGGDKMKELESKAEEKLGLKEPEPKKLESESSGTKNNDDPNHLGTPVDKRVMYTEESKWVYEPITGFTFKAKLSDVYGACIKVAEDFDNSLFVTVGDIIRNIDDIEYEQDLSLAADAFGWDTKKDNVESIIPRFENGYLKQDGTTCIKLEFSTDPQPQRETVLYQ